MYLTVHATAGLALAKYIPNPILAFVAAVLSHLVLDAIPHGDEYLTDNRLPLLFRRRRFLGAAILDSMIMLGFVLLYIYTTPLLPGLTVGAALVGALLPDALQGLHFISREKWLTKYAHWHGHKINNFPKLKLNWQAGMLVQIFTLTALWLIAL